ncbi:enoyl-CoA hydratase/isomerase family protein [Microbacterium sp. LjRoot45]|uniref:enoyl-CoA hydratase/isomerase family protein n=1 Tax=Microbacterium sp. LjRoot45 TaxID=3342329 RepID=UPI003ECE5FE7
MSNVRVERNDAVLRVRLDRAEKRNALTREMLDDLHAAVDLAEADGIPVMVISAAGAAFCAGADIATYVEAIDDLDALADFGARAKSLMHRLSTSPPIVVAAVDGIAMGGGFELVLAADLVYASDRARFGLPEITLGLIPGWEGTQRLVRHLGPTRAKEAILRARAFSAEEMERAGLLNGLTSPERLPALVEEVVADLGQRAPLALAAAKRAIGASYEDAGRSAGTDEETRSLLALFASNDGREGVRAFVEKRAARFEGR